LVLAVPRERAYFDRHPTPEDILLVVEVADTSLSYTSLSYERHEKSLLYAKAGVVQYLVMNAGDCEIEDHRDPSPNGYRSKRTYRPGESITLVAFPDISIEVQEFLPRE
jgi:Uma2 family endonuclease